MNRYELDKFYELATLYVEQTGKSPFKGIIIKQRAHGARAYIVEKAGKYIGSFDCLRDADEAYKGKKLELSEVVNLGQFLPSQINIIHNLYELLKIGLQRMLTYCHSNGIERGILTAKLIVSSDCGSNSSNIYSINIEDTTPSEQTVSAIHEFLVHVCRGELEMLNYEEGCEQELLTLMPSNVCFELYNAVTTIGAQQ